MPERATQSRSVGVIGLGIMGGAIARNLLAHGWRVTGYDPDAKIARALAADGVRVTDLADLIGECSLLLTSLPSPQALSATVEALAESGAERRILVELSTLPLSDKFAARDRLAAAGHEILDCPISGTGAQARTADLAVYASGDAALIAGLAPLFGAFARSAHDVGAYGNGSRMKFVANLLVAIHNVATAEALVLAERAGLDLAEVIKLMPTGAGASRIFDLRAPLMAQDRYRNPTMKMSVWQKDMAIIAGFAVEIGAPTPLLDATARLYDAAMVQGHGDHDTAAVYAVLRAMAEASDSSEDMPE
jgi:3-hydroxyisobutyrate dehydrogenase-like beta-hydroxyacid dehydrogenase